MRCDPVRRIRAGDEAVDDPESHRVAGGGCISASRRVQRGGVATQERERRRDGILRTLEMHDRLGITTGERQRLSGMEGEFAPRFGG